MLPGERPSSLSSPVQRWSSLEGRDRSKEAGGDGLENGSPSYCLGFPAGLFLVHIGLSYKGLEAEAHADK